MKDTQQLEIGIIEDASHCNVGDKWWENLIRDESPTIGANGVVEETGSGVSPGPTGSLRTYGFCICLQEEKPERQKCCQIKGTWKMIPTR